MRCFRLVAWCEEPWHGPHLHRGHADGRPWRRGPGRPVLVAEGRAGEVVRAIQPDRSLRTVRRPGALRPLNETGQKVGFITPLSHNFCEAATECGSPARARSTCASARRTWRTCARRCVPTPKDDGPLEDAIRAAIAAKPKGHDFDYSRQRADGQVSRHMSHTGG